MYIHSERRQKKTPRKCRRGGSIIRLLSLKSFFFWLEMVGVVSFFFSFCVPLLFFFCGCCVLCVMFRKVAMSTVFDCFDVDTELRSAGGSSILAPPRSASGRSATKVSIVDGLCPYFSQMSSSEFAEQICLLLETKVIASKVVYVTGPSNVSTARDMPWKKEFMTRLGFLIVNSITKAFCSPLENEVSRRTHFVINVLARQK